MKRSVRFQGAHCTIDIGRRASDVVVVTIVGTDVGELGDAPLVELTELVSGGPVRLFIDTRAGRGASMDVSNDWALWFRKHRSQLTEVTMLTGSSFIHVTADFVRRFSQLEGVMRLTTDPVAFDEALETATLR